MAKKSVDMDTICYTKNFLTKVIVRVNFQSPIVDIENKISKKLKEKLKNNFPILEPIKMTATEFQLAGPDVAPIAKNIEKLEWHFFGLKREKKLTIASEAFFIEYNAYESYELLKKDFTETFAEFINVTDEIEINFIGLRYINNIELTEDKPLEWGKYIHSKMLQILRFTKQKKSLSRIFQILEYNFGDYNLRYQFGMHNPDYPAPIRRKLFTLDIDAYYSGLTELSEIPTNLDRFHEHTQTLFEESITDDLRGIMHG